MIGPLSQDLADLRDATRRLSLTLEGLDDVVVRRPSLLPGWSVGHVLTHLARNADGLLRLVDWALTGVPTPMYDSPEARERDIEAGAGRTASALVSDVHDSAEGLSAAFERLSAGGPSALDRLVIFGPGRPGQEPDSPARTVVFGRIREVEIHHVDLGLDSFGPSGWPETFVERTLMFIHARSGAVDVVGDPADVLAWRLGRGPGTGLHRVDGSGPGAPPAW